MNSSDETGSSLTTNTDPPHATADNLIRHADDSRDLNSDKEASSNVIITHKDEGRQEQQQQEGEMISGGDSPLLPLMIKNHPLFPLIEYFLIKCEKATRLMNESDMVGKEVEFIILLQQELHQGRLKSDNAELDDLMLNYVQNLNYQLHELRKVDELCNDFLRRYSARLRARFAQESLFCVSAEFENELPPAISACLQNMPPRPVVATIQTSSGPVSVQMTGNNKDPPAHQSCISSAIVPVSDVSVPNLRIDTVQTKDITSHVLRDSKKKRSPALPNIVAQIPESFDDAASAFKTKRNSLPRRSVEVLRKWLFQNMTHPYPSDDEKHRLSAKTGLNLTQVNNWFINARRRILQPLLDGNSSAVNPEANNKNWFAAISSMSNQKQKSTSSSTINYQTISSDTDDEASRDSLDFYDAGTSTKAAATETDQSDTNSRPLSVEIDQLSTVNLKMGGGGVSSNYHSIDQLIGNRSLTNRERTDSNDASSPPIDQQPSASTNQKQSTTSSSTNQNPASTNDDQSQSDDPDHSNSTATTDGPSLRKKPRKRRLKLRSKSGQNLNSLIDGVA